MSTEKDNIIKFSSKNLNKKQKDNLPKNYLGFDYIKMENDLNGTPFIKENLIEYSNSCKYLVRLFREKDNKNYLYTYCVKQEDLPDFLIKNKNGVIDGILISVEMYIPESLA